VYEERGEDAKEEEEGLEDKMECCVLLAAKGRSWNFASSTDIGTCEEGCTRGGGAKTCEDGCKPPHGTAAAKGRKDDKPLCCSCFCAQPSSSQLTESVSAIWLSTRPELANETTMASANCVTLGDPAQRGAFPEHGGRVPPPAMESMSVAEAFSARNSHHNAGDDELAIEDDGIDVVRCGRSANLEFSD